MFRSRCLVCRSPRLTRIIDLGIQPFADSFIPEDKLSEPDPAYPLECDLCRSCGHVQTSCVTDPRDRYEQLHDYSYTSSNSAFATNHWKEYAATAQRRTALRPGAFVVEVGSNDGFLAAEFKAGGHRVLGVDPSRYMRVLAAKRQVRTVTALFGRRVASTIRARHGAADVIVANNVFNHADDPRDFVAGAASLLRPDGWFVFEQPSWLSSVTAEKLDQVYHEHVSYFTVRSLRRLLGDAGLHIVDASTVDYHGGSLRVFARKSGRVPAWRGVNALIRQEREAGLFDPAAYEALMARAVRRRNVFLRKLYTLKARGATVLAVGAPAKGNTFLNFHRLDRTVIEAVTDASSHKQGKYTPLTRIPIVPDSAFAKHQRPYALVLSWNLVGTLRPLLRKINPNVQFISPEDPA